MGFAAANARKLLSAPLIALGSAASALIPRSPKRWLFASATEPGEGVEPLAAAAAAHGITVSWLVASPRVRAERRARGLLALPKRGLAAWWATARASTVVVTHGLGDAHPAGLAGARIVQLWHGIPLKKLHLDAGLTYQLPAFPGSQRLERALRAASGRAYRRIWAFVAASEESAARLQSAFGLRFEQMLVTGDPRDDCLLAPGATEQARTELAQALGRELPERVVLFAPTWRESANDPTVPSQSEWADLAAWAAARELLLVVRPHPLASASFRAGIAAADSPHLALLTSRQQADLNRVLAAFETLITDFSSVAYDFALLERPIVFFAPDLAEYSARRGLYEPFERFAGGSPACSWAETIARLSDVEQPQARQRAVDHARNLARRMHAFHDGRNTERVVHALLAASKR